MATATASCYPSTPFTWEGTDRTGKKVKGKIVSTSEAAVRAELRRQGVVPTRVRKQSMLFRKQGKVTPADIAIFSRQLATMMTAGIPLVQSFDIVGAGHENPAMQKLILAIKGDVEGGTALADALAKHPLHFDDLFVNLVSAGEQAGALETLLDKIATYKEKTEAIKKKIKKALFYPAAVVVVAIVVTADPADLRDSGVRVAVPGLRRGPAGVHALRHRHFEVRADAGLVDAAARRGRHLASFIEPRSAIAACSTSSIA